MHLRSIPISNLVNCIPLIATVVTTALSVILARATLRYAAASDKSLALAREEFEREWSPELHIKLERVSSSEAKIIVTNLAKISVLLQLVQFRKLSHAVPFERCFLNEPLVGGMTWTDSIRKRLVVATGDDFQGPIAVSVTFYASGRLFRTDWFRFQMLVKNGNLFQIEPLNMTARRVRVLEPRDGEVRVRRELARDVTAVSPLSVTPVVPR
jgi:cell division protein FtsL